MKPEEIVDLQRYPLDRPQAAAALAGRFRQELATRQCCALDGFLTPTALERAVADARALRGQAYDNNARRNCYLQREPDPGLPEDHPRNLMFRASTRMIAYDLLPEDDPVGLLYRWAPFREFVRGIVDVPALHENADPYQPVNLLCYEPGDESAWHFDSDNAFTITLMLQAPEAGGEFEFVADCRSDDDQNHPYVREVLLGERPDDVVRVAREPGALCIFRGCHALHRVAPVAGSRMRIMAVMVYETEPGVRGDPEVNRTVYGPRVGA